MTQDFLEFTEGNYPISEEQMLDFMEMGVEPKGKQEMKLELKNSLENEVNKSKEIKWKHGMKWILKNKKNFSLSF